MVDRPGTTIERTDGRLRAQGDEEAFAELYDRHAEAVGNHAYRLTASWATAEDLTSSAFLTAWRRRHEVTLLRDSALPWLYQVAGNLAHGEFRRKSRFQDPTTIPTTYGEPHDSDVAKCDGLPAAVAVTMPGRRILVGDGRFREITSTKVALSAADVPALPLGDSGASVLWWSPTGVVVGRAPRGARRSR